MILFVSVCQIPAESYTAMSNRSHFTFVNMPTTFKNEFSYKKDDQVVSWYRNDGPTMINGEVVGYFCPTGLFFVLMDVLCCWQHPAKMCSTFFTVN